MRGADNRWVRNESEGDALIKVGMIQTEREAQPRIEAAVVQGAQRLEPAALDRLVEAYAPRLYGYFRRATGSSSDAEDLVQDVFVRVVRMIPQYVDDGRFDAWIFRIATNLQRDRVRRLVRSPIDGSLDANESGGSGPGRAASFADGRAASPSQRMETADNSARLELAMMSLPQAEREVVLLRHYGELSFNEIAELMDTPLGTALARAHRGLKKLRESMESP